MYTSKQRVMACGIVCCTLVNGVWAESAAWGGNGGWWGGGNREWYGEREGEWDAPHEQQPEDRSHNHHTRSVCARCGRPLNKRGASITPEFHEEASVPGGALYLNVR